MWCVVTFHAAFSTMRSLRKSSCSFVLRSSSNILISCSYFLSSIPVLLSSCSCLLLSCSCCLPPLLSPLSLSSQPPSLSLSLLMCRVYVPPYWPVPQLVCHEADLVQLAIQASVGPATRLHYGACAGGGRFSTLLSSHPVICFIAEKLTSWYIIHSTW